MNLICPITEKECFGSICEFYNKDMQDCVIRDSVKASEAILDKEKEEEIE